MDHAQLANDMREEHGIVLKGNVLAGMQTDQQLSRMKKEKSEEEQICEFFNTLSDKKKAKLMKKLMSGESLEEAMSSKKKSKKNKKDKKKKSKKSKKSRKEESSDESADSEDDWKGKCFIGKVTKNMKIDHFLKILLIFDIFPSVSGSIF